MRCTGIRKERRRRTEFTLSLFLFITLALFCSLSLALSFWLYPSHRANIKYVTRSIRTRPPKFTIFCFLGFSILGTQGLTFPRFQICDVFETREMLIMLHAKCLSSVQKLLRISRHDYANQIYFGAMTKWLLRKSIPGSMLQKQYESNEQQRNCAIVPKTIPQELFHAMDCDNFAQSLGK